MNHDQPRALSRFGNDKEYRLESAKMLATFLLTLRGTPYIYQGEEIGMINVAQAENDKGSIYHYYQDMIKLRKDNLVLVYGGFELLVWEDEKVFAYLRGDEAEQFLVVLNFSGDETRFLWPEGGAYKSQELVISNYVDHKLNTICDINLRPFEARVYKLIL